MVPPANSSSNRRQPKAKPESPPPVPPENLLIVVGAFAGGFVNGLTGFGTALTALPLFLMVLSPPTAAILAAAIGATAQAQTLPSIWRHINWPRALPLIIGGLAGLPVGTMLLPHVSMPVFKILVGLVLIGYCSFMLLGGARFQLTIKALSADVAVGVGGGIMAGLSALAGPLPIIWAGLQGWGKDERRGVFQAYNSTMLTLMLVSSAVAGLMTRELGSALLWALPAGIAGTFAGTQAYRRLDDRRFDRLVLLLLLVAGITLVLSSQIARPS
jgi:uncharacterized membrane protein YfcA